MAIAIEHNVETGEIVERPMTDDELKALEVVKAAAAKSAEAAGAAVAKKASILAALATTTGYTVEELKQALNA